MDVNFDWYQTFYYVAKLQSISLAAEKLFISQPAVSQVIKQLERALGCPLFIRTSRGMQLTAEGQTLYDFVETGVDQIKLGEHKLKQLLNLEGGELRIGASDMTLQFYLLPHLEKFHKQYPAIKINVTNGPTPETIRLLKDGKIDFGIVSEPFFTPNGFISYPVAQLQDIFLCSAARYELTKREFTPAELVQLPLICLEGNTSSRKHLDTYFAAHHLSIAPEFELATSSLIVEFVKRDLGIGCVTQDFAQESLSHGEVFALHLSENIPLRHMRILKNNKSPLSKAGHTLLEMLPGISDAIAVSAAYPPIHL